MPKLSKPILVKLIIGDKHGEGHGLYDECVYDSNYPVKDLQDAYRKSCRAIGVQFHSDVDYTGTRKKYDWIFTEQKNNTIRKNEVEALQRHGLLSEGFLEEHNLEIDKDGCITACRSEDAADLIMAFIAYSMPKDFFYQSRDLYVEPINRKDLDFQFGFGLYED